MCPSAVFLHVVSLLTRLVTGKSPALKETRSIFRGVRPLVLQAELKSVLLSVPLVFTAVLGPHRRVFTPSHASCPSWGSPLQVSRLDSFSDLSWSLFIFSEFATVYFFHVVWGVNMNYFIDGSHSLDSDGLTSTFYSWTFTVF